MKPSPVSVWSSALIALVALGCTQLKPVASPTTPVTPTGDTPATTTPPVPDPPPFGSPSPSPTPSPEPTPPPVPKIVLAAPSDTSDFTAGALDVIVTVTAQAGRKVAGASISYDGQLLKAFTGEGPTFKLEGWNPNQVNNFGEKPDATSVKNGAHKLTIVAKDDKGGEARLDYAFEKPLKITGWEQAATMPAPVTDAMAFSDGQSPPAYFNVWGSLDGFLGTVIPRTQVYSFNPAGAGAWTEVRVTGSAIPRAAYGAVMHPGGTVAYLVGGKAGGQDMRTIDTLSLLRKVAEQNASQMANARRDPAVAYLDNFVYAIGGAQGDVPSYAVERIKIDADGSPSGAWSSRSNLQNARAGANAWVQGKEIWVFGGGFKPIEVYDAAKNEWRFMTNKDGSVVGCPEGWANSLMVPVGTRLFFFGGTREDGQAVESIYEFNTKTKSWRNAGPLPTIAGLAPEDRPETRMSGFYRDGTFYLIGGKSVPDGRVSNRVFKASTL